MFDLRSLESKISSTGKTARLLNCSRQRVWFWRRGEANLSADEQAVLEAALIERLAAINETAARVARHRLL